MRLFDAVTKKPGASPGTVQFSGEKKVDKVRIRLFQYDVSFCEEKEFETISECLAYPKKGTVRWINIDGLHDVGLLKTAANEFGIHPLILEDIVHTTQRPKAEIYEKHIYTVLKMFYMDEAGTDIQAEQMSFILGEGYVLSFQERVGDVFEQVRQRIRTGGLGNIRKSGADYLFYALLDAIVDHYFAALEKLGESLEAVDEALNKNPGPPVLRRIHDLKKEIVFLRKNTWPLRELFQSLLKNESHLIDTKKRIYFQDVYDHVIQVLDTVDGCREMISSLIELYQSSIGNRMNEVMKVLTIIATIFIPPTFVAGIYGMNFDNMPELHAQSGYFIALGVMLVSIVSMLVYFRIKKWI